MVRWPGRARGGEARTKVVDVILFETTQRCNAACAFCYNHWVRPAAGRAADRRREPSTRRSLKALRAAIRGSGCRQVSFTGGESTLRDDLFDLIAGARIEGATVSVLTNGSQLDDAYARDLAKVGCGLVQLTFCGVEAAAHDALCGEGSFVLTSRALGAARQAGLAVGLTFVATRRNQAEAPRFPAFAREAGVTQYLLNRYNPGGRGLAPVPTPDADELMPTLAGLREMLAAVDDAAARAGVTPFAAVPIMPCLVSPASYPHLIFASGCAAGTPSAYFTVDSWGDVRFCNHTPTILGNVLEQPFDAIARSPRLAEFKEARPPFCVACPGWSVCRGGCRAAAEQTAGRWDSEDPLLRACLDRGEIVPPEL
jgi:radical SAM protein with 4Fe4S-binding SPASM domain